MQSEGLWQRACRCPGRQPIFPPLSLNLAPNYTRVTPELRYLHKTLWCGVSSVKNVVLYGFVRMQMNAEI